MFHPSLSQFCKLKFFPIVPIIATIPAIIVNMLPMLSIVTLGTAFC